MAAKKGMKSHSRTFRNKHGYKGVEYHSTKKKFRATSAVGPGNKVRSRWLSTAVEAAKAFDDLARRNHGPDAYLNFPKEGENQAILWVSEEEGSCIAGHDLSFQYTKGGKRSYCRICNRESVMKYKKSKERMTA